MTQQQIRESISYLNIPYRDRAANPVWIDGNGIDHHISTMGVDVQVTEWIDPEDGSVTGYAVNDTRPEDPIVQDCDDLDEAAEVIAEIFAARRAMAGYHVTDAWLGPAADELTIDQRDELDRLVLAYEETQKGREGEDADYTEEDNAAWVAALEQVEGTLDVAARGRAYRDAKTAAYAGAIIAALSGTSEVQAARDATITRRTLRQLLGKTPR